MNKIALLGKIDRLVIDDYVASQVSNFLDNLLEEIKKPQSVEKLITEVTTEITRINYDVLISKTRKREVVFARYYCYALEKELTTKSLKAIGNKYGGRDHSTIIHGLEEFDNLYSTDKNFERTFNRIQEAVYERIKQAQERKALSDASKKRYSRNKYKEKPNFPTSSTRQKQHLLSKRNAIRKAVLGKYERCIQ